VTGTFEGSATLGQKDVCTKATGHASCGKVPNAALKSRGRQDIYVAKYDGSDRLVWAMSGGGSGDDKAGGVAFQSTTGQIHGEGSPSGIRRADPSDTWLYLTGTVQGPAKFGDWSVEASQALGQAPFIAKLNASSGDVLWARTVGDCWTKSARDVATHIAYDIHDPVRTNHLDTLGECEAQGLAVDGAGNAIITGRLFGIMSLPSLIRFTFEPRNYFGSIHANRMNDKVQKDPIEVALGFTAYEEAFTMSNKSFVLELEEEETGWSLASKLSNWLGVPRAWVSLLKTDGTPMIIAKKPGQPGYNKYSPYPYMPRWEVEPSELVSEKTIVKESMMVQICNSTWRPSTRETPSDATTIQTLLDRDAVCRSVFNEKTMTTTWYCPTVCSRHSECVSDSMCIDQVCHSLSSYCVNITASLVKETLASENKCVKTSGSGRSCTFETFIAKFDEDGLFRWANTTENATRVVYGNESMPVEYLEQAFWADRAEEVSLEYAENSQRVDDENSASSGGGNTRRYTVRSP